MSSRYPYLLPLGIANIRLLTLFASAMSLVGRPYRVKTSKVGNMNLSIISKPVTIGCPSGIIKTKPSVVDGGSL